MGSNYLGIDVSMETLDVCLLAGGKQSAGRFDNAPAGYRQLLGWLKKQRADSPHACLEATGQYSDGVAEFLYQQGLLVSVVNPARIKAYGQSQMRRNKTDKADAQLIASFCAAQRPAAWTPPPPEGKALREMVRYLEDLQSNLQQEQNRLRSGVQQPIVLEGLKKHIHMLQEQIQQLKQAIQTHINHYPELKRRQALLATIKGIGKLTAAKLLGEIPDILAFHSARQLAAYAGVTPKNFESGKSVHKKARLSKMGRASIRKILYMPAVSAKRWNPAVKTFCDRLLASGHCPMQAVGAAMRKLLHLIFGVLKSGRPFDPHYLAPTQVVKVPTAS